MRYKDYSIAKDDDIAAWKVNIEKEEKEVKENRILEKTKFILGEEGHI